MKQRHHEDPDLKAAQDEWYGRLKREGFKDIEDASHPSRKLIDWHKDRFSEVSEVQRLAAEYYYDKAKDLMHTYKFKNETHRKIWELHCDGVSNRKIEPLIERMEITYKHSMIDYIVKAIAVSVK